MKKLFKFSHIIAIALTFSSLQVFAIESKEDCIKNLIGPYPPIGSQASDDDFATLHFFQNTRTPEQCAAAATEVKANLETFFGKMLSARELKQVKAFFLALKIDVGIHAGLAKFQYRRPRPFLTDPSLKPCIKLEKTYAYPSGHTTMARLYARVLAHMYPERAEAFMRRGDEISMHRVLGGVHHPSDIVAGKKLGDAMANEIVGEL
jgi:acid phosphatase (class A)